MRPLFAFLAALFLFAATLQYNDPDPLRWMTLYAAAAVAALLAVARVRAARIIAAVVGLVAFIWGCTYIPAVVRHQHVADMFDEWTMKNQEVVQNRELFGLLIVTGTMAAIVIWLRPRASAALREQP